MKKKNYNYKFIIGIIIGLLLVTGVSAASTLASNVYYENEDTDVQSAIDYLAENIDTSGTCPEGKLCIETPLKLGDYVSYTPTSTSYDIDTTMTGYTGTQSPINPSELNLWRVLNINDDGTVDIISEYVSSTAVFFEGQTGYLNFVGYLNVLASQYENSTYTVGSRHFGYNRYKSQTQYITDTSRFTSTNPITSSTIDNSNEAQGGGDTLYLEDYNKVTSVLGTAKAYNVSATTTAKEYWMASRLYIYNSSANFNWIGRYVRTAGSATSYNLYRYNIGTFNPYSPSFSLRPIVTLKSGLKYTGMGTSGTPWQIAS